MNGLDGRAARADRAIFSEYALFPDRATALDQIAVQGRSDGTPRGRWFPSGRRPSILVVSAAGVGVLLLPVVDVAHQHVERRLLVDEQVVLAADGVGLPRELDALGPEIAGQQVSVLRLGEDGVLLRGLEGRDVLDLVRPSQAHDTSSWL